MIRPLSISEPNFKADNRTINRETGDYKDPLMRWPLRGAAFTNEIGEALRPVIGSYATLSWVPALLYIGADVYDKYKNDQTEYSPDSRRCLKQAVFQGMASIFLPLVAVKIGQNSISQIGKFSKDKIGLNTKEHISKLAEQFIANGKMRAFDGKDEECINEFLNIVTDARDYQHNKNSIKKYLRFKKQNNEKISEFSRKTITELIELRKKIINPSDEFKNSKWYKLFEKDVKGGQTKNVAVKSVLSKFQQSKMLSGNFVKTLGGFIALGIAIKPIDYFVENVLIGKYVGPEIDKYRK